MNWFRKSPAKHLEELDARAAELEGEIERAKTEAPERIAEQRAAAERARASATASGAAADLRSARVEAETLGDLEAHWRTRITDLEQSFRAVQAEADATRAEVFLARVFELAAEAKRTGEAALSKGKIDLRKLEQAGALRAQALESLAHVSAAGPEVFGPILDDWARANNAPEIVNAPASSALYGDDGSYLGIETRPTKIKLIKARVERACRFVNEPARELYGALDKLIDNLTAADPGYRTAAEQRRTYR